MIFVAKDTLSVMPAQAGIHEIVEERSCLLHLVGAGLRRHDVSLLEGGYK